MRKTMNPADPVMASAGSELQSWAAAHSDFTTAALALKQIYRRVAVSEPVALVIARHAGLMREFR